MNLKCYNISDDIVNQILFDYESDIVEIKELEDKSYYEYKNKIIFIKSTGDIICPEYVLDFYIDYFKLPSWKQVRLIPSPNRNLTIEPTIDGPTAWLFVMRVLSRYYSMKEIDDILQAFCDSKETVDKQFHYTYPIASQNVQKLALCVKYDINGAHADAICEMFPKAKKDLESLYRKSKMYLNLFVGMLQHNNYSGAYWHIVDRTTKKLFKAMDYVGGTLVYANTDGFAVMNPKQELPTSTELGDFKLEHRGNIYFYINTKIRSPYYIYQFGEKPSKKTLKGSCMTEARKLMNLANGEITFYDRRNYKHYVKAENIVKELVEIDG